MTPTKSNLRNWAFRKRKIKKPVNLVKQRWLMRNPKYTPLPKLFKRLDTIYSIYIRLKHMKPGGYIRCYTCNGFFTFRQIDCGHYIGREEKGTRYLEPNTKPQCKECNEYHEGRKDRFARHLIEDYGPGILDQLNDIANQHKQYLGVELEELIIHYKAQVKILKKEKGEK